MIGAILGSIIGFFVVIFSCIGDSSIKNSLAIGFVFSGSFMNSVSLSTIGVSSIKGLFVSVLFIDDLSIKCSFIKASFIAALSANCSFKRLSLTGRVSKEIWSSS